MTTIDEFVADFDEDPGYLNFASVGPLSRSVEEEERASVELLRRVRFGSLDSMFEQDERVRRAVAGLIGFRPDQVAFQPNTSTGLMHAMFGITGGVALSPAEFPSLTFAAARAAASLGVLTPLWLESDYGRLTPGAIRDQLESSTAAVAVSLVDFRSGYLADLEGIRQVIGDRLLVVDAIQGFGVVDAPFQVADVIVSGGQKWVRAGWGTGFLALSDRALERLTPVFSGFAGTDVELPLDAVLPPAQDARAYAISNPSPIAEARLAGALEQIAAVGVDQIAAAVSEKAARLIETADQFGIPVVSPREANERAGIVVLRPPAEHLTVLAAALLNHGVTVTVREQSVRLSAHVTTDDETFDMLRASFTSFASAITV